MHVCLHASILSLSFSLRHHHRYTKLNTTERIEYDIVLDCSMLTQTIVLQLENCTHFYVVPDCCVSVCLTNDCATERENIESKQGQV